MGDGVEASFNHSNVIPLGSGVLKRFNRSEKQASRPVPFSVAKLLKSIVLAGLEVF